MAAHARACCWQAVRMDCRDEPPGVGRQRDGAVAYANAHQASADMVRALPTPQLTCFSDGQPSDRSQSTQRRRTRGSWSRPRSVAGTASHTSSAVGSRSTAWRSRSKLNRASSPRSRAPRLLLANSNYIAAVRLALYAEPGRLQELLEGWVQCCLEHAA